MEPIRLGILGYPIQHTLSPVLHAQLLTLCGLTGTYEVFSTPPEALADRLAQLKQHAYRGVNVTIPLKIEVVSYLHRLTPNAQLMQAVNTVLFECGEDQARLIGDNTDVSGFMNSLPKALQECLPNTQGLVLGVGGSARAVFTGLIQANIRTLILAGRSPEKVNAAIHLANTVKETLGSRTQIKGVIWQPEYSHESLDLLNSTLVVNTTPIGMAHASKGVSASQQSITSPLSQAQVAQLPVEAFVYDLIYRPLETSLLVQAKERELQVQSGLDMLILQGVSSFELWTGKSVGLENLPLLRESLLKALQP